MPLPKPTLDNRNFDQLVAEGRGLIPRLAPPWTDHNTSDPGITLIELSAWLTEQNIYRFDRLSDEAIRRFARLAGAQPLPPLLAGTVIALGNGSAAGITMPARMQVHDATGALFETTASVHALPAQLVALGFGDAAGKFNDLTAADAALQPYAPLGSRPRARAGHAFYLGFDRALDAVGATLSLHLWTDRWREDLATREALIREAGGGGWRAHYRTRTLWEYHAGGGTWLPLTQVVDETRALSLSGFVRFAAPVNHQVGGVSQLPALFFIRCRLMGAGYECAPRLLRTAFNAVAAEHAVSRAERVIGAVAGHAGARFVLQDAPIVAGSVMLRLDNGAGDVQTDWSTRLYWDDSGPHDRHVLLVPEDGELLSGNGLRGQTLPADFTLHAAYRTGGGSAGNIAANTLSSVPPSAENTALAGLTHALSVSQPFGACGGAPRETLDALRARAYALASAVDKAVTLRDFERLALAASGVPVARVHAVTGVSPKLPCYPAPGSVMVVVVPRCRLPAPMPSRALLEAVRRHLEPRRLVTSDVHVLSPRYRRVSVHATLHLATDVDAASTLQRAHNAIDRFFDPLSGGPEGGGWPLGRAVYRSEAMALLATLPGVTRVTGLGLQDGAAGGIQCDNIELCAHELVRPGRHRLRAQSPLPIDLQRSDPNECEHAR